MPILILAYIFNYLDRNNVGFAGLTMNQAIGLTATQLGFGAGVFFIALLPARGSQQPRPLSCRCARVAVAHHDLVGTCVGGNGLCRRAQQLLRPATAARRGGSWLLPRRGLLSRDLVSRAVSDADDRVVHGGDSGVVCHRRTGIGLVAGHGRRRRDRGMAVAVHHRRTAGRVDRHQPALVARRSARGRVLAVGRGAPHRSRTAAGGAASARGSSPQRGDTRRARDPPRAHAVRLPGRLVRHRDLPAVDAARRQAHRRRDRVCEQRLLRRCGDRDDPVGPPC